MRRTKHTGTSRIAGCLRTLAGDRRGISSLVFAAASLAMLGMIGIAIEAGSWYKDYVRLQGLADMAAQAGAMALAYPSESAVYQDAANYVLQQNGFNPNSTNAIVHAPPTTGPYAGNPLAVQATLTLTETPWIASLFTTGGLTLSAQAVATYNQGPNIAGGATLDGTGPCLMALGVSAGELAALASGNKAPPTVSVPYVTPSDVAAAQTAGWNPNIPKDPAWAGQHWAWAVGWDNGQMLLGADAQIQAGPSGGAANGCSIVANGADPTQSIELNTLDIISAYTITSSGGITELNGPAGIDTLQRPASQFHVPTADPLAYVQNVPLPGPSSFTCANIQEVYAGNLSDAHFPWTHKLYPPVVVDGSAQSTTDPHKPHGWHDGWPAGWTVIPTEPPAGLTTFTDTWSVEKYPGPTGQDPNWGTPPFTNPAKTTNANTVAGDDYSTRGNGGTLPPPQQLTTNYTAVTVTVPFSCFHLSPGTDPGWSFTAGTNMAESLLGVPNPKTNYILTSPVIVLMPFVEQDWSDMMWWTNAGSFIFNPRDAAGKSVDVTVYFNGYASWAGTIDLAPGTYFFEGPTYISGFGAGGITCSLCFQTQFDSANATNIIQGEADNNCTLVDPGCTLVLDQNNNPIPTGRGVTLVFMGGNSAVLSAEVHLIAPQQNNYDPRLDGILAYYASADVDSNGAPLNGLDGGLQLEWGAPGFQRASLTGAVYAPFAQIWFTGGTAATSPLAANTMTGCAVFIGNSITVDPDFSVYADLSQCNSTYGYPFGPGSQATRKALNDTLNSDLNTSGVTYISANPVPQGAVSLVQ